MNNNTRTLLMWVLIIFAGWTGYRLNEVGAFRAIRPSIGKIYGNFPIVGKPIRKWAYKKSYRRGRRYYKRRGRKGVSRRRRYRRRR